MAKDYAMSLDDARATLQVAGGKGASMTRLVAAGMPVPDGFHVTTEAYQRFVDENDLQPRILAILEGADLTRPTVLEVASQAIGKLFSEADMPSDVAGAIAQAYADLDGGIPSVAVRSSATAEDLPELSFAGQQETYLNVQGGSAVLSAVKRCWASLWTARAIGYRERHGIDQNSVKLAVIVQRLVPAEAAGILFTANPVTGARDQATISAAWGLGEAIVGGMVTPDTLIVDKATGEVLARETADKQVMTVRVDGGTGEQSVPEELRNAPVLDDERAGELVGMGVQIERLYAHPVDIEWALVGSRFYIVQARPITALPSEARPAGLEAARPGDGPLPPTEWRLPQEAYIAMRNNIVELMPDPLSPLFGTLGLASVNASLGRQMTAFLGKPDLIPKQLIITVNGYAYYNGSMTPGQIAQIFLRSAGILRRMFAGAVERWTDIGRPRYVGTVQRWQATHWREFSATEILNAVRELLEAAIDAYGALVSGVIPAAWISEGLFTVFYNTLVKRRGDPAAPTYVMGFNSMPIQAEKSLYDLAEWSRTRAGLADHLGKTPTSQLADQLEDSQTPPDVNVGDWHKWQSRFRAHLQQYGHTIYDLDFAHPVPADDPVPLLETFKLFIAGQGINPHTRQQTAAGRRKRATKVVLERVKGLRRKLFHRFVSQAQRYAPLREDGLADVGLSYRLMRQMLNEVGRRLADGGMIAKADDIFWLNQDEVEQSAAKLDRGETLNGLEATIPQRKAIWRAAQGATPPLALAEIKFLGVDIGKLRTAKGVQRDGDTLKGVAASPGRVTAPARVLHGPEDFGQMKTGDVLVTALTTPAWTPLFARAAAIVTDIGGPLSHGSIVAREYGIPAVLGTGAATKRIRSGQAITVDGSNGTVILRT